MFPALKLSQNCYLQYKINIFSWKNCFLLSDATCCTERLSLIFNKIWRQGDRNLNFPIFYWIWENLKVQPRLFKNPNFPSLLWIGDQILNLWMNWEKLCSSRLSLASLLQIKDCRQITLNGFCSLSNPVLNGQKQNG